MCITYSADNSRTIAGIDNQAQIDGLTPAPLNSVWDVVGQAEQ
jgi:hypothetical protein